MKLIFVFLGFLFFGLGCVGAFLPVLPTVPFLLAASFCFTKGSDRFSRWFKSTSVYQNHLKEFEETRTMKMKTKLAILLPVSALITALIVFTDVMAMRIVLIMLLTVKYYYFLFRIKTNKAA